MLVSPYELGRQPFGLAEAAAWLQDAGFAVRCIDLSRERLDAEAFRGAGLVAVHLAMHTAGRIAAAAFPRMRELAPRARFAVFGLYAPVNEAYFRELGAGSVLGGEVEPALVAFARECRDGAERGPGQSVHLDKIEFRVPDRSGLPPLPSYARLELPDGGERIVGFAEASRGCKHLCRHCPIVPVYDGRFRVVSREVVLADIRQQVAAGAEHISFGDPDFFNGPTHALRIVEAMHAEHPRLTFDATIKVEHLLRHRTRLPSLRDAGCLFITSAVEAVDDGILARLRKNHTTADFEAAAALMREVGIALAPTFVAFTPWTTLAGYRDLLERIAALGLVASVPPVQLSIRLLVPDGSRLLELPDVRELVDPFDRSLLGWPWRHPDPRVDRLQARIADLVESEGEQSREETFAEAWRLAHAALGESAPALPHDLGEAIPRPLRALVLLRRADRRAARGLLTGPSPDDARDRPRGRLRAPERTAHPADRPLAVGGPVLQDPELGRRRGERRQGAPQRPAHQAGQGGAGRRSARRAARRRPLGDHRARDGGAARPRKRGEDALRGARGERRAPGARARGEARAPPRTRRQPRRRAAHQARPPDDRSTYLRLIRRPPPPAPTCVHPAAAAAVRRAAPARGPEAPLQSRGSLSRPAAPGRGR